jgi:hypothetical protein
MSWYERIPEPVRNVRYRGERMQRFPKAEKIDFDERCVWD